MQSSKVTLRTCDAHQLADVALWQPLAAQRRVVANRLLKAACPDYELTTTLYSIHSA